MNVIPSPSSLPGEFLPIEEVFAAHRTELYFEVSPLFEEHWTGIPVVAAELARALLTHFPHRTHFFFERHEMKREAVEEALAYGSGLYLARDFANGHAQAAPLPPLPARERMVGLFPSVKRLSQLFPIECSLYHDLSTMVTPHFHVLENIRNHQKGLIDDLRTNTLTFAVSAATMEDLIAYLGAAPDRVFVAHNGVEWPPWYEVEAANLLDPDAEPYFLVLATREPRKNISLLLEFLCLFPEILETSRVQIIGRAGWLEEKFLIPPVLEKAVRNGRIVFPGFVPDFEKYLLLKGAEALIYPSFFEGFGLPVLEALSVGTPVITSFSSSLPEIGGDLCFYIDPFSAESLYRAVREVQTRRPKQDPEFQARAKALAARFTWRNTLHAILSPLAREISRRAASSFLS